MTSSWSKACLCKDILQIGLRAAKRKYGFVKSSSCRGGQVKTNPEVGSSARRKLVHGRGHLQNPQEGFMCL